MNLNGNKFEETNVLPFNTYVFHEVYMISSGGFRGGSRGSLEPPSGPKLFHFHGKFQETFREIRQTNPPFLHLNPHFLNPGSAPDQMY